MKKIFNAPRIEVVEIENDVICSSPGVGFVDGEANADDALAPTRRDRYHEEYDLY